MANAFKPDTGPDRASHIAEGMLALDERTDVVAVHFQVIISKFVVRIARRDAYAVSYNAPRDAGVQHPRNFHIGRR